MPYPYDYPFDYDIGAAPETWQSKFKAPVTVYNAKTRLGKVAGREWLKARNKTSWR